MQRTWHIVGMVLLWVFVVVFAVFYSSRSRQLRAITPLQSVSVDIIDSLPDESLMSRKLVEQWVATSGIPTVGTPVAQVDLAGIEKAIRSNGFVDRASAYVTHDGVLHIKVSQRKPVLRLITDGYDSYVTEEGFVFTSPGRASVYVPVVSGSYAPPVDKKFVGNVKEHILSQIELSNARIAELQLEKKPFFDREKEIKDSVRNVARLKVVKRGIIRYQGWGESDEEFKKRVIAKRLEKDALYRRYRYWRVVNNKNIDAVTARQNNELQKQKKLMKRYEDFTKLINFVKYIEDDSFWGAEIVQIEASTMSSGALELKLIPRTGSHTVLFGEVGDNEQNEEKLERLYSFYQNGLRNLGWDSFRTISVKYKGQVVCSK